MERGQQEISCNVLQASVVCSFFTVCQYLYNSKHVLYAKSIWICLFSDHIPGLTISMSNALQITEPHILILILATTQAAHTRRMLLMRKGLCSSL